MTEGDRAQWLGYMREFDQLYARRVDADVRARMVELSDEASVFFSALEQRVLTKFERDQCSYRAGMWARRARDLRRGKTNRLFGA